jgi:hypothetical protein
MGASRNVRPSSSGSTLIAMVQTANLREGNDVAGAARLRKRKAMIETTARRIVTMTRDGTVGSWKSPASLHCHVEF